MKQLYIFDLDGTLANMEHRVHFIKRPSSKCFDCGGANRRNCVQCADLDAGWKADWRSFFAACADDTPIDAGLQTLMALRRGGAETWIWTGRSDEVKAQTVEWLCKHGGFGRPTGFLPAWPFQAPERLMMRKAGDHQPDVSLKRGWLADLEPPERNRLTAVFEDRASVVEMWREMGVPCFQVARGEF